MGTWRSSATSAARVSSWKKAASAHSKGQHSHGPFWPRETGQGYTHPGGGFRQGRGEHSERRSKRRGDGRRGLDAPGEGPGGPEWGAPRRSDGGRSEHRGRRATLGTQGRSTRRRKRRRV